MSEVRDSIIHAVHFHGKDHDIENFRGCTHPDCKELRKLFMFVADTPVNVESVRTWHSGGGIWLDIITLDNGQVLVVSDELVAIWKDEDEFFEDRGGAYLRNNSLSRIITDNEHKRVKHLEHMIEVHMNVIDKLNARIKGLEDIVDELNKDASVCERGMSREHEHVWRQSPNDAGYTFCCLCGIERED